VDNLSDILVMLNSQLSYMLVGATFALASLLFFRRLLSMFIFVVFGLLAFAIIKFTIIQPMVTGSSAKQMIQEEVHGVQERINKSIGEVKNIKEKVKKNVEELKEAPDKFKQEINRIKPKEEDKYKKLMNELEHKNTP
jgi:cell shape-determining protein MreC